MDLCPVLKKLCFLLMIICPHALAVTHSVQYLYTVITPEIHFTAVGLLDAEQFVYYDTNFTKMIPKTEWMRKIDADYPDYWNNQTQRMQRDQENLKQLLHTVMKSFNHTGGGVHTLQRKNGCELDDNNDDDDDDDDDEDDDNGTVRGYDQLCYDGEDLIKLDLKRGSWIAANDKALTIEEKWESAGAEANIQKSYLEKECIEWIKRFVYYSEETVERKDGALSGWQIALITVPLLALVTLVAGLIFCNKSKSGHRDYVARADILEL